jgi:hypothetical protein
LRSAGRRYSVGEIGIWVGMRLSDFAFGIAGCGIVNFVIGGQRIELRDSAVLRQD